jgi:hypothetical protein
VYLMAVRRCLIALQVTPRARALALALAASSGALFFAATDFIEPLSAAAVALAGIAFAAGRTRDPARSEVEKRRAVLVAVAAIALAALLYQGVILAAGLLLVVVPRPVLRDRKLLITAGAIFALVPVTIGVSLALAGHGATYAAARVLSPGDNPLYNSYLRRPGPAPRLVALLAGPPQGLIALRDFHGLNGVLAGLRSPALRGWALENVALLAFGGAIVGAGVIAAVRRRQWSLLAAFAILLILPVAVRYQQYGYLKYYIMLPFLVAVGASRARPALVGLAATVLILANGAALVGSLRAERAEYDRRVPVYTQAGAASCWLTSGWVPRFDFRWPGQTCAILANLQAYIGEHATGQAGPHAALSRCLDSCFCQSSAVFTDDMTDDAKPGVRELAEHFQFSSLDLTSLTLPPDRAIVLTPGQPTPVLSYPRAEQQRLCALVRGKAANPAQPAAAAPR